MYFDSIELYFFRAFFVAFGEWVGGTGGTRLFHIFIDRNEFSGGAKISYLQRYEKKIKKKKKGKEKKKKVHHFALSRSTLRFYRENE